MFFKVIVYKKNGKKKSSKKYRQAIALTKDVMLERERVHQLVGPGRAALLLLHVLVLADELAGGARVAARRHQAVVADAAPDLVLVPHLDPERDHGTGDAVRQAHVLPHVTGELHFSNHAGRSST